MSKININGNNYSESALIERSKRDYVDYVTALHKSASSLDHPDGCVKKRHLSDDVKAEFGRTDTLEERCGAIEGSISSLEDRCGAIEGNISSLGMEVDDLSARVGDIDTALDGIIAIEEQLIGGDN